MSSSKLAEGTIFSSFEDLEKEIERYQRKNFVQFYRRDSRTIDAAIRRSPKRTFNANIRYSEIVYSCIHGGKKFKSECKGMRPQQQ